MCYFNRCHGYAVKDIRALHLLYLFWLVGSYLLFRDFEPNGIIFMNVCVVIAVSMAILLRNFGLYFFCVRISVVITFAVIVLLRDFGPYWIIDSG
jgi:hypothetical protein